MNKYPKYKESGVEWIGEIPENWKTVRLKYLGYLYGGLTGKKGEDFVKSNEQAEVKPYISFSNIGNNNFVTNQVIDRYVKIYKSEKQNRVTKNDLLFLMSSENYEDLGRSSLYIDDYEELYLNSFCKGLHITDKNINPNYLEWLLLGDIHRKHLQIFGNGFTRINLRQDYLSNIAVITPPHSEQTAIASYLDHKTSLIDKLIKKNEKLIKLLEEKRKATINQAVTKGLNPNVKMKDSGVEWIGEIPEHWEVKKLKWLGEAIIGITYSPNDVVEESSGRLVMRASNIKDNKVSYKDNVYVNKDYDKKYSLSDGDILICSRSGSKKLIGKNILIDKKGSGNYFGAFMTVFRSDHNKYIYHVLNSSLFKYQIDLYSTTTINQLTISVLRNIIISFPPSDSERNEIIKFLESETKTIDTIMSKLIKQNSLLKEYRQSLISNVVTGKIDVRDSKLSIEANG